MKAILALLCLFLSSCSGNLLDKSPVKVSPRVGKPWSVGVSVDVGQWRTGPAWTLERIHNPDLPPVIESDPPYVYPIDEK